MRNAGWGPVMCSSPVRAGLKTMGYKNKMTAVQCSIANNLAQHPQSR